MALVMVITTIALISMLIVAIFSITRTEYKATQNFVSARSAKQLGDIAVAITQAQIQNAQNTATAATSRTIHATQPGMVRVYNSVGNFVRAHKLYSSSQMVITSNDEAQIFAAAHQVPTDWNSAQNKARFVDLNEPVVRPGLAAGTTAVYFPIIDPRAAYTGANPTTGQNMQAVEGFSYEKSTPTVTGGGGAVTYNEVVLPTEAAGSPNKLRLPMPVEWIYILEDGTTGALDASGTFITSESAIQPSATNPIIGRVAFWTDDETSKININTAAEPTFFAPPYFYHKRDAQWANFPGTGSEYQRYPGHPATVALSAVLAPGVNLDPLAQGVNVDNIVQVKEYIYDLIPKVATGGSMAGTRPFVQDDFSNSRNEDEVASMVDTTTSRLERLFANVDEMLFKDGAFSPTNGREAARYDMPGGNGQLLFDHDTLERARFFLTAHSRAPDFSSSGLPRISMWPVADEGKGPEYRTNFDNMIALCSTLRGQTQGAAVANSYIFRRAQAHHATHDVTGTSSAYGASQGLARNSKLLDYLYAQMTGLNFPATSSLGGSSNFGAKYGVNNAAQLCVQFFDYIRSTNLYDGVLARENDGSDGESPTGTALYTLNDNKEGTYRTYTNHRVSRKATGSLNQGQTRVGNDILSDDAKVFPGHGQVTPAVWQKNGQSFRGFGRMFTLSEVGFHFICTADGQNDEHAVVLGGVASGGGSAPRVDPDLKTIPPGKPDYGTIKNRYGNSLRWYSNYPPLLPLPGNPDTTPPAGLYGTNGTQKAQDPRVHPEDRHPYNHPGYDPENWNMTLANRTPLREDEKRIQAMFLMETFCPMLGWTKIHPEYAIVLDGNFIGNIMLTDSTGTPQRLFDTTQDVVIKSNGNLYESNDVYSLGGHAGPTAMAGNRAGRPVSGQGDVQMASDAAFVMGNTTGHNGLTNYGLNSNFITVKRNQPMQLSFGSRNLVIKIYDKHRYQEEGLQPIQIININFEASQLPVPALVYSQQRSLNGNRVNAMNLELNYYEKEDEYGRLTYWRSLQGPHWWCFNYEGCLGRLLGKVNPEWTESGSAPFWLTPPTPHPVGADVNSHRQSLRGRLDTTPASVASFPGTAQGFSIIPPEKISNPDNPNQLVVDADTGQPWTGSDVIRTMVPAVGDYRLIAARYDVPAEMWMRHPLWTKTQNMGMNAPRSIHSFTTHWATSENGVVLPTKSIVANTIYNSYVLPSQQQTLVSGAPYADNRFPDLPPDNDWTLAANSYGDFDNGIGNSRDGPWINKPDEGNFYAGNFVRNNITKYYRSGYFFDPWKNSDDWRTGVYMTPNRMVTSPVMFGSLSTGVWPGGSVSTGALTGTSTGFSVGKPWQTLLFRPYAKSNASMGKAISPGHPGDYNPRDHYLLDLFQMPVVEPYAISEPLSTAGKININYQIMPFTNIRRATAVHALMKGEFMTTIPTNNDVNLAKTFKQADSATWGGTGDVFYDEATFGKYWHRPIDVTKTLYMFDQKFNHAATGTNHASTRYRGLFRTASQICEMHLIPDVSRGASQGGESITSLNNISKNSSGTAVQNAMDAFWQAHSATGDNTRERPYANLYARVTTRSNTFRVHVRAQLLRKARSVEPNKVDVTKDKILAEYRGSSLIERYIDPTDTANPIPDYGAAANPLSLPPLETFYKFRTLESKRFSP